MDFKKCAHVFNKVFKRHDPEDAIVERAVGQYLLTLPICTGKIVVVSPQYTKAEHYHCEIVADAAKLLPWAENHAKVCWSSGRREQAARVTLPLLLRMANLADPTPTYLPDEFSRVLEMCALGLINQGIAKVICLECNAVVADIQMRKFDESRMYLWSWWTSEWKCPAGHLLYHEKHTLKLACPRHQT